jgi:HEPN domain-containing protein
MKDEYDPSAWVARAEEDFIVARSSMSRKKPLTYSTCFHAQQCAEKYLKALLVDRKTVFPKTHDLLLLSDLCTQAGFLVPIEYKLLNALTDYSIRVRYPGEDPSPEEAREAFEIAKAVRKFARKILTGK